MANLVTTITTETSLVKTEIKKTMDPEKKKKILDALGNIPEKSIVNYILRGEVSATEVTDRLQALHKDDKVDMINAMLMVDDDNAWNKAIAANTTASLIEYQRVFPNGRHITECISQLTSLDNEQWQCVSANMTAESLNNYIAIYPNGLHAQECREMLADLPWLEARKQGTIASLQQYQTSHPGRHTEEITKLLNDLNDETDWQNTIAVDQTYAYQNYLNMHPTGNHVTEAQQAIAARAGRDRILGELRQDINAFSALDLQYEVNNHRISWGDLEEIYMPEEIEAIKDFRDLVAMPPSSPPDELETGTTEVYFWGTQASGKTCALGAILSAANSYGILTPQICSGSHYMNCLCNTFSKNGICNLPKGTGSNEIYEMRLDIRDIKGKKHPITLIDMAGEAFSAMYRRINGLPEPDIAAAMTIETAKKYLSNDRNKKVHFFIVAYDEEYKELSSLPGIAQISVLQTAMQYLAQERIIRKSTNGVYLVVTKVDKMNCAPHELQQRTEEYVEQRLPSFYNSLRDLCSSNGVSDFGVIPFSVGHVFAETLCHLERDYTDEVLNKLIAKSATEKGRFGGFLNS